MTEEPSPKIYLSDLRLSDGMNEYHFFDQAVAPGPDEKTLTFAGKSHAAGFVERCMEYMHKDELIRLFLNKRNLYSRRELAACVADRISSRPLIVVPITTTPGGGGQTSDPIEEKDARGIGFPNFQTDKIRFKFIDDSSGRPVKGITVKVTGGDGNFRTMRSDNAGEVTWNNLKPGACALSSDITGKWGPTLKNTLALSENRVSSITSTDPIPFEPPKDNTYDRRARYYLAKIKKHRVADGETLQSIAEENNMTFADLAYFNWGVYDNKKVFRCMRRDIGCSKPTKNRTDFHFQDSDTPGIVFIPEALSEENFPTGQTHVIKVSATGFALFYESFQVTIVDDKNKPMENVLCDLKHPDGTTTQVESDKAGVIALDGINARKTKIRLVDYDSFEITKG